MEDINPILEINKYNLISSNSFARIFKNFSFLTFGKILGDFFTFLLFVIISRKFGHEGIGQYSFGVGLSGFFAVCADFGLYNYSIKEISRNKHSFENYIQNIFSLRVVLSSIMLILLLIIVPFLYFSVETKIIIIIMGIYQIFYSIIDGLSSVFIANEKMHIAAAIELTLKTLTTSSAIVIIFLSGNIVLALLMLPTIALFQLFILNKLLIRKIGNIKLLFSASSLITTFKKVLPFGTTELLYQLYARIDIVLIGFFLGESSAGLYNVGYRVVFFLLFIPKFASIALFPIVSKLFHESKFEFQKMYNKSLSMILIIGLPISAVIWLISPGFVELIFGSKFSESSTVLRILASLFVLNCISSIMEIFLMASDHQTERTKSYWYTTTICTLLNICFILFFRIEGAALAVLFSSFFLVILLALKLKPVVGLPDVKSNLLISILGVLIFSIIFSLIPLSIFIIIPGSMVIYLIVIMLFKGIRENEIRMVLDLIPKK